MKVVHYFISTIWFIVSQCTGGSYCYFYDDKTEYPIWVCHFECSQHPDGSVSCVNGTVKIIYIIKMLIQQVVIKLVNSMMLLMMTFLSYNGIRKVEIASITRISLWQLFIILYFAQTLLTRNSINKFG